MYNHALNYTTRSSVFFSARILTRLVFMYSYRGLPEPSAIMNSVYDLSRSWDKVDLELWTVTFAGLAKPNCNVCSSPYHDEDVSPSADLNRKSRCPSLCFDFNKSSGCRRRNCSFPHVCRRCYSSTHPAPECTQPQPSSANKAPRPSDRSKK